MRLNELCTGLLGVLVLLLLLDSSSAQPHPAQAISKGMVAKKKITDPHYRHQQQYGSYGSSYTASNGYHAPSYSDYNKYGGDPYKLPYKQGYTNKPYRDAYDDDYYKKPQGYGDDYYSSDSYDSYDSYGGYGKKKQKHRKMNDEVKVSTTIPFHVSACNAKYPGVLQNASTLPNPPPAADPTNFQPTSVMAWWQLSCERRPRKHKDDDYGKDYGNDYQESYGGYGYAEAGSKQQQAAGPSTVGVASRKDYTNHNDYGSYGGGYGGSYGGYGGYGGGGGGTVDNVGQCWFWGITETGIAYKEDVDGTNHAFGTFMCQITSSEAKECDPGLAPVEGSTIEFVGTIRVRVKYMGTQAGSTQGFTVKEVMPPNGVVATVYNGQAGVGSTPITDLPLRRYNTGRVTRLDLQECGAVFDPTEVDDQTSDEGTGTFEVKFTI